MGLWTLGAPLVSNRVGGSDTPWSGNWVVSGHTLQAKWSG